MRSVVGGGSTGSIRALQTFFSRMAGIVGWLLWWFFIFRRIRKQFSGIAEIDTDAGDPGLRGGEY
jgi:hypothetical protein